MPTLWVVRKDLGWRTSDCERLLDAHGNSFLPIRRQPASLLSAGLTRTAELAELFSVAHSTVYRAIQRQPTDGRPLDLALLVRVP